MTPLEIYKLLPQTNCRKCLLPSCLAFSAAVASGDRELSDCPDIHPDLVAQCNPTQHKNVQRQQEQDAILETLYRQIGNLDFTQRANERGGTYRGDEISFNSMGKDFVIDRKGRIRSQCHIIPWVQAPILTYLCHPTHRQITGQWQAFRDFKGGQEALGLFRSRCEIPLKELADKNSNLLYDLLDLFEGTTIDWYEADIALQLHPLPHIPLLFCYQAPEDGLESNMTILFDACCEDNLPIRSLYGLAAGMVNMFTKIARQHI